MNHLPSLLALVSSLALGHLSFAPHVNAAESCPVTCTSRDQVLRHLDMYLRNTVRIITVYPDGRYAYASGVCITGNGLVVTNRHSVTDSDRLYVLYRDGKGAVHCLRAQLVYIAEQQNGTPSAVLPDADLALLFIGAGIPGQPEGLMPAHSDATPMEELMSIGYPELLPEALPIRLPEEVYSRLSGEEISCFTTAVPLDGTVVQVKNGMLLHTAPAIRGNSGGALVSLRTGKLVGISCGELKSQPAISSAIPISLVMRHVCHYLELDYNLLMNKLKQQDKRLP